VTKRGGFGGARYREHEATVKGIEEEGQPSTISYWQNDTVLNKGRKRSVTVARRQKKEKMGRKGL